MGVIDGRTWNQLTSICPQLAEKIRADIKPRRHPIGDEGLNMANQFLMSNSNGQMSWQTVGENQMNDKITKFIKFDDALVPMSAISHVNLHRNDEKSKDKRYEQYRPAVELRYKNGSNHSEYFDSVKEAEKRFEELEQLLNEAVSEYHERNDD